MLLPVPAKIRLTLYRAPKVSLPWSGGSWGLRFHFTCWKWQVKKAVVCMQCLGILGEGYAGLWTCLIIPHVIAYVAFEYSSTNQYCFHALYNSSNAGHVDLVLWLTISGFPIHATQPGWRDLHSHLSDPMRSLLTAKILLLARSIWNECWLCQKEPPRACFRALSRIRLGSKLCWGTLMWFWDYFPVEGIVGS